MKDPRVSIRSRPYQSKKLKLLCSFNGTFQPRPPSGKLRYTGGETRFVLVDRNIGFSTLKTKVSELFCPNNGSTFSLQYQLPGSESIDEDTLLVLIASDDDVRCMIDDYDILESHGKPTRLWIFVCDDNEHVNGYTVNNNISVNCTETQNLNDGFGEWYVGDRKGTCVKSVNDSVCDNGHETQNSRIHLFGGDKVNNSATSVAGVHYGDDSLRKMVLKKLLLAKQSAPIRSFHSGSALAVEQTEMDFTQRPVSHETKGPIFCGDSFHSGNTGISSESSSKFVSAEQLPKQSYQFNINKMSTDFHAEYELRAPLNNLNRENIVPWDANFHSAKNHFAQCSCSNQMIGSVYPMKSSNGGEKVWGILHSGIHNHRTIGHGNARNHRTTPYYVQNHQNNLTVVGSGHNDRMVGRPWVHPGISSSSSISKQGQALRSYLPTLWKPSSGYHDHDPVSIRKVMNSRINNRTYSLDHPHSSKENLENNGRFGVLQHGTPNPKTCHMAYHDASTGMYDQSLLPLKVTDNPSTRERAMDAQEDLLTSPSVEEHEVPHQAPCESFDQVPMNSESICDELKNEPYLMDLQRAVSISGFSNSLGYGNGTELECNSMLPDLQTGIKSFGNLQYSAHAIQGGTASSVDLSFCNLSSLSKEMEPPANSSATSNDVSETSFKPQLWPLDLMDEERLSSGQQVEKSDVVASNYSSQNAAELEKDEEQKQEIQQEPPGSLSIDDKIDIKGSHKFSKVNGGIPRGLVAFYTHLVTRELQNIKNSDLEYIKELGSGAYGTVFYGKWKGSDVVIKRIKPSCFKEGSLEDDRLVADFWKEAHILDHLHHPNIVAFYGVVTDGPTTNLATVTEYMVNGSLKQVLHKKDRTIDQRKRLIIAMDAAFGMAYLHEKNIVHFDLKSDNLLANMRDPQRPVCKIGDLGLSRIKQRTFVSGGVRGTIRWMAPELLNSKNMVTEKVDVYSFGIVMWELLTGEQPYANLRSEEILAGIIEGDLRPEIPSWCHPSWKSLMERCWSSDPDSRPPFSEIAKELRAMSAAMNIK